VQEQSQWRLIDFGSAARCNELSEPSFTLRFAAPEAICDVVAAQRRWAAAAGSARPGPLQTIARPSEDVWAIGVIAFELFSGTPFYNDSADTKMIKAMLLGTVAFPHETDDAVFEKMGRCGTIVRSMLQRDVTQRLDIHSVVQTLQDVLS
jgi:hypothetical protein